MTADNIYSTNLKIVVSNICQIFTLQQTKEFQTFHSIYKNTYANAPRNILIEKIRGISSEGCHIIFETCTCHRWFGHMSGGVSEKTRSSVQGLQVCCALGPLLHYLKCSPVLCVIRSTVHSCNL